MIKKCFLVAVLCSLMFFLSMVGYQTEAGDKSCSSTSKKGGGVTGAAVQVPVDLLFKSVTKPRRKPSGGATLEGKVYDEDTLEPIERAIVGVKGAGFAKEVLSDEKGEYCVANCPTGKPLTVTGQKARYNDYETEIVIPKKAKTYTHDIPLKNFVRRMVQAVEAEPLIDLAVRGIYVNRLNTDPFAMFFTEEPDDQKYDFDIDIKNVGTEDAENVDVVFKIDNEIVREGTIRFIRADGFIETIHKWGVNLPRAWHTLEAELFYGPDMVEENNKKEGSLLIEVGKVPDVDIEVRGVTVDGQGVTANVDNELILPIGNGIHRMVVNVANNGPDAARDINVFIEVNQLLIARGRAEIIEAGNNINFALDTLFHVNRNKVAVSAWCWGHCNEEELMNNIFEGFLSFREEEDMPVDEDDQAEDADQPPADDADEPPADEDQPAPDEDQPAADAEQAPADVVEVVVLDEPIELPEEAMDDPDILIAIFQGGPQRERQVQDFVPKLQTIVKKVFIKVDEEQKKFWTFWIWILLLIFHIIYAASLHMMAKKSNITHRWLAWIPLANIYLVRRIIKRL